ncbi:hypothetical protein BDN72DRAFT_865535 [Pluteus cervinus]|uniref:Uncharacterized protein n=1 Tax=Pluteus cervinus TaxID=181527 RepID=A0ACD2ZZG0_9AGAR|nr:hypothetical protein BDN72DRAFT_865535 [Pluteus cervinus]
MSVPLFALGPHALSFGRWDFHDEGYLWVNDSFDGYGPSGTPFLCSIIGNVQEEGLKCDGYGDYHAKAMKTLDTAGFSLVIARPTEAGRGKQFDDALSAVNAIHESVTRPEKTKGPVRLMDNQTFLHFYRSVLDDNWFFSPLDVYDAQGRRIAAGNVRDAMVKKDVQVVFTMLNRVEYSKRSITAMIDHVQLLDP